MSTALKLKCIIHLSELQLVKIDCVFFFLLNEVGITFTVYQLQSEHKNAGIQWGGNNLITC